MDALSQAPGGHPMTTPDRIAEAPATIWAGPTVGDEHHYQQGDWDVFGGSGITYSEKAVKYVRADKHAELHAENARLREALDYLKAVDERGALDALEHGQQQADMDGIMVTVSRQAVDMIVESVRAALSTKEAE